ncbi:hypothetical protein Drorol1_Dr00024963 [Drosera rotundifolia]
MRRAVKSEQHGLRSTNKLNQADGWSGTKLSQLNKTSQSTTVPPSPCHLRATTAPPPRHCIPGCCKPVISILKISIWLYRSCEENKV